LSIGIFYYDSSKNKKSEFYLKQAIQKQPDFITAYLLLGDFNNDWGSTDKAIYYLEKAKKLDPKHPILYKNLGRSYKIKGELKEAKKNFETALSLLQKSGLKYRYIYNEVKQGYNEVQRLLKQR